MTLLRPIHSSALQEAEECRNYLRNLIVKGGKCELASPRPLGVPQSKRFLQETRCRKKEYEELYDLLHDCALFDLTWKTLETPRDLESLVTMKRQGANQGEIFAHFRHPT